MIHFVIGTRAQLFKMAPIMLECEKKKLAWRWVYTAQHKDTIDETLDTFSLPKPDYTVMNWGTEAKTMTKMLYWFFRMCISLFGSRKILDGYTGKNNIVLTHGDTLTTWWGALLGRVHRCRVMHVESGLRSFNIWKPFPEEINRLLTFRLSQYYACPGDWALDNLKKYKGIKINTQENTQVDTIKFGMQNADNADFSIPDDKYVVVSIHRYENIFKKDRFKKIIEELEYAATKFKLLIVQHPATFIQLDKLNYRKRLEENENIELLPRLEYLSFIKAIKHSEFVITDGGGNQEELYHMGKPTLIFRNETERQEGIGTTALISGVDHKKITSFINNYKSYIHRTTSSRVSPSLIIVEVLEADGYGEK